ncbi:MAG TPA: V-type ATP synthase subunit D [Firmicutes bacterium]|nr:V-type ATP synthase subunit D [Bacillota bacterium]
MDILNVNPTRMEMAKLKKRLAVARRGHKLLKDKRDELMKIFLDVVRKNKELREQVEELLTKAHQSFLVARAVMSVPVLEEALMFPKQTVELSVKTANLMSVTVPRFSYAASVPQSDDADAALEWDIFPYGFATTSSDLDASMQILASALPLMLELAESEKSAQLLAQEIEKTRRRVNALEHVLIPQLTETIRYITMKLEENERGNITRMMKVKDMMLEQMYRYRERM